MISISDVLKEIITSYPLIEDGLSHGIINYSAFARKIRPQIENRLYKPVTEGSVVMALKRISKKLSKRKPSGQDLSDLTVRSNLREFTFINSSSLAEKQRKLFNQLANQRDVFCAISQGIRETTLIANTDAAQAITKIFANETKVAEINNLSSITIHLSEITVKTPGVYYQILKLLAWENINIIEVISTYTELTIVFENKNIDKAFSVLKKLNNTTL